jgi:hypothetical protein
MACLSNTITNATFRVEDRYPSSGKSANELRPEDDSDSIPTALFP